MRVLISSIGSRGDVQPILALAVELRAMGHEATLCVAPNFSEWVESYGVGCVPIGPDLKKWTGGSTPPARRKKLTLAQRRELGAHSIREQFQVLGAAARGCDLIVGAGALQLASRSIAEALRIPFVFTAYCPAVLPSPDHPPPRIDRHFPSWLPGMVNRFLWKQDEARWDALFRATVEEERTKIGLGPLPTRSVQSYVFTERPWLAADATLGPAASFGVRQVVQTGAWLLPDDSRLPDELVRFLASGDPPIYFGFGSVRAAELTSGVLVDAARQLGRRAIISQGWGKLGEEELGSDCLTIGDVNQLVLFPRAAAIVHHGGAGTTTAAARGGVPQVVIPNVYDQYYWAHRVRALGVGDAGPSQKRLTTERLVAALRHVMRAPVVARARDLAARIELNGARMAAERLVAELG
jgi:vancomycin aglycone glucosyltransferase